MFAKLKEKLEQSMNKYAGNTDFLEAVCASAALVAAADGEIEDEEIETATQTVVNHPQLAGAFTRRQMETTLEQMFSRTKGRTGRMGLYNEISDIAKDPEMAEVVYLTAMDVSEADGEVEPQEKEVLAKIAQRLSINPANYDV